MILGKYIDGYSWKGLTFTSNVIDIAANPASYSETEQISNTLTKEFIIEGQLTLPPIFYGSYVITYAKNTATSSKFSVHKYYKDISHLAVFNEDRIVTDAANAEQGRYSFVFFDKDFGVAVKHYNSANIDRFSVQTMSFTISPSFNTGGYFNAVTDLPSLVMIQRKQDPDNPEEQRDVYGFIDNSAIYRITADSVSNSLTVAE